MQDNSVTKFDDNKRGDKEDVLAQFTHMRDAKSTFNLEIFK